MIRLARRLFSSSIVPAWLISVLSILILAALSGPLSPGSFARWDSGHYLSIAKDGYQVEDCNGKICGNAAWLPGYPLLIRMFSPLFPTQEWPGFFLSNACHLLALMLLARERPEQRWLLVFFPGSIYFHAIFPLGSFLLAFVLLIYFLSRERFLISGLCLAACIALYSSGLPLLFLSNLYLFYRRSQLIRNLGTLNVLPLITIMALFFLFEKETGDPFTYLRQQATYGRSPENPLGVLVWVAKMGLMEPYPSVRVAALQTMLVVFCLVSATYRYFLRPAPKEQDGLILFFSAGLYLLALSTGKNISLYRQEALLVPLVLLLPRSKWLVLIFALLFLLMSHFFFQSLLV